MYAIFVCDVCMIYLCMLLKSLRQLKQDDSQKTFNKSKKISGNQYQKKMMFTLCSCFKRDS